MTRSCCCSCCCSNFSAKLKENNLVSSLHVFSFSVYLPLSLYLSHPVSPSISLWLYLSTTVCLSIPVYVCLRRHTSLCFAFVYFSLFLVTFSFFQEIQCSFIFAAWLALPRCQSECEVFAFSFRVESKN